MNQLNDLIRLLVSIFGWNPVIDVQKSFYLFNLNVIVSSHLKTDYLMVLEDHSLH